MWDEKDKEEIKEEKDKEEIKEEKENGDDTIAKDSPMYIPKEGRYYHHDSRFNPDSEGDDNNSEEIQNKT